MAEGISIGYDFSKDECRISFYREGLSDVTDVLFSEGEDSFFVKNSICKKRGEDAWLIGTGGYETALLGDGVIVDKLLRFVEKSGVATFESVLYSSDELLYHFVDETLKAAYKKAKTSEISALTVTLEELRPELLDAFVRVFQKIGIAREKIHFISHAEALLYYILSQPREQWANMCVLYDLSGSGLTYYEVEIRRGTRPNVAISKRIPMEEGFDISILDTPSGMRMADSIMSSAVKRQLEKKIVSTAYLSGNGMVNCQEWGNEFLRTISGRRKVFYVENIFAEGALYEAEDRKRETTAYPFRMMCEGRIKVDIMMEGYRGPKKQTVILSSIGENWYDVRREIDFIPDEEDNLKLYLKRVGENRPALLEIPLSEILDGMSRKKRIGMVLQFTSDNSFQVTLRDKGFGEFFPSSDRIFRENYTVES